MSTAPTALPPERLRWRCDPDALGFETTADVVAIEGVVGQQAAVEALEFGLAIDAPGQNVFVRGLVGTGRLTLVKNHLSSMKNERHKAPDYVYVHNFDAPDRPRLLRFESGRGRAFVDAIDKLIAFIETDLKEHVSDDALTERHDALKAQAERELGEVSDPLEAKLKEADLSLTFQANPDGSHTPALLPRVDGEEVTPEQIAAAIEMGVVTQEDLEALGEKAQQFKGDLDQFTAHAAAVGARLKERLTQAVRDAAVEAIVAITKPMATHFPSAEEHLQALAHDLIERRIGSLQEPLFTRLYAANLITIPRDASSPAAIVENSPSVQSLLGSIDTAIMPDGSAHAPHMGLHAGALVHANGGVLIMDARDLANASGAWQALTRTLRNNEVDLTPPVDGTTQRQPGL
ncbi:MAG: AAA family ATPase, partial [Myxococcota bacterium]